MKSILFIVTVICSCVHPLHAQSDSSNSPAWTSREVQAAIDLINGQNRLLIELASERYSANSNRNEIWILTAHDGDSIRKYTDKKHIVLSLPIVTKEDRIPVRGYAHCYNSMNLRDADFKVKAGKFREAKEVCELVLHFSFWEDESWKDSMKKRLNLLEKLQKGEDRDENLKKYLQETREYGSFSNLSEVDKTPAEVVPNLLKVLRR